MITKKELEEKIIEAGVGSSEYGAMVKPEGYYIMQQVQEYAEFIYYMQSEYINGFDLTLAIGIAGGGEVKFFRDVIFCKRTIVIDDGSFPLYKYWFANKEKTNSDIILDFHMDSKSYPIKQIFEKLQLNKIDYAFIDGDHEYLGLKNDINLVCQFAKPGCVIALHDTDLIESCKYARQFMQKSKRYFKELEHFSGSYGISLFELLEPGDQLFY